MPIKKYRVHKEGFKIIAFVGLFLVVLNAVLEFIIATNQAVQIVIASFSAMLFIFTVAFFRIPKRFLVSDEEKVIAPADGKIVVIEEVENTEYFNDRRIQVSIFMSPTNVHVNRNPVSGTVKYTKYHPGGYLVAWHPKSSEKNERHSVVIGKDNVDVLVTQIAGKLARRIVNYLKEGDEVQQGDELGFIKFGSRVDIFMPLGTEILVTPKQKVKGGITTLGILPDAEE